MINETFSFPRFRNYFVYDLKQLWRNNGRAVIVLGGLSLLSYLLWVTCALIFTHGWQAPTLAARGTIFYIGALILVLYNTRSYGYLTEKKAGSAWLMVPASALEKFISMMIITVFVFPLSYVASYMLIDGVICLIDSTAGQALIGGIGPLTQMISEGLERAGEQGLSFNLSVLAFPVLLQFISNLLYFLLCGICFKKWKLIGAFGILVGVEIVITAVLSIITLGNVEWYNNLNDVASLESFMNAAMTVAGFINAALVLGLGWGIYHRIKTLKH